MSLQETQTARTPPRRARDHPQVLGVGDALGTGDSYLIADLLPPELAQTSLGLLHEEVKWQTMHHRGGEVPRLVAVQGEMGEDGSYPVYRHPADESPPLLLFSPTVQLIRDHVQNVINHPVNHVLIQYYRTSKDYISEHSDKTIDVIRGSNIVNVSLGAQRVMTLRLKKDAVQQQTTQSTISPTSIKTSTPNSRPAQRIPLPHNSMFVLGPGTNERWLHGINADGRPPTLKLPEEHGSRISLTFRHIGTFLCTTPPSNQDIKTPVQLIWGQGATSKSRADARAVIHGGEEAARLIEAFGEENHKSVFNWDAVYGQGFDVLNFSESNAMKG